MIKVELIKAPNENYLGLREFHLNQITMGPDADIIIKKSDSKLPEITILIQGDSLLFKSQKKHPKDFHVNNKLAHLPFSAKKEDHIAFDDFLLVIREIETTEQPEYHEFLDHQYEQAKKDKKVFKSISELSRFSD